ncbi:MAG: hypothetical protein Kow00108_07130 [Calditrichia bacterium]
MSAVKSVCILILFLNVCIAQFGEIEPEQSDAHYLTYLDNPIYFRDISKSDLLSFPFIDILLADSIMAVLRDSQQLSPKEFKTLLDQFQIFPLLSPFISYSKKEYMVKSYLCRDKRISNGAVQFKYYFQHSEVNVKIKQSPDYANYHGLYLYRKNPFVIAGGNFWVESPLGLHGNSSFFDRTVSDKGLYRFKRRSDGMNNFQIAVRRERVRSITLLSLLLYKLYLKKVNEEMFTLYSNPWYVPSSPERYTSGRMVTIAHAGRWETGHLGGIIKIPLPMRWKQANTPHPYQYHHPEEKIWHPSMGITIHKKWGRLELFFENLMDSESDGFWEGLIRLKDKTYYYQLSYFGHTGNGYDLLANPKIINTTAFRKAYSFQMGTTHRICKTRIVAEMETGFKWDPLVQSVITKDNHKAKFMLTVKAVNKGNELGLRYTRNNIDGQNHFQKVFIGWFKTGKGGEYVTIKSGVIQPHENFSSISHFLFYQFRKSRTHQSLDFSGGVFYITEDTAPVYLLEYSRFLPNQWLILRGKGFKFSLQLERTVYKNWLLYASINEILKNDEMVQKLVIGFQYNS